MKYKYICYIILSFLLISCDDINDSYVDPYNYANSIVGNWYMENTALYSEYTYTTDGNIYINEYRRKNGYKREYKRGTFHHNDNIIVSNIETDNGLPVQSSVEIINRSNLTITTRNSDYGDEELKRIVGIINIQVNDSISFDIHQFLQLYVKEVPQITSYTIADTSVATIDEGGIIEAKMIGVTYLLVETTVGPAVVKISVTDYNNLWNDFSQELGKNLNEVEASLGKYYAYKNDTAMQYFYDNYYIDSLEIYQHNSVADSIVLTLKSGTDKEDILNYLNNKLYCVKDTLSHAWFCDNPNYLFSKYSAKYYPCENKLHLTSNNHNWGERSDDFYITYEELKKKYGYGRRSPGGTTVSYNVKNDFISSIVYSLKSGMVCEYDIYVNIDVSTEMINEYLNKNFIYLNSICPWAKNIQINGVEHIMEVSFNKAGHRLHYFIYH